MCDVAIAIARHAISACDFASKVDRREDRRDGHPAIVLMGCRYYGEVIAVEIACAASS